MMHASLRLGPGTCPFLPKAEAIKVRTKDHTKAPAPYLHCTLFPHRHPLLLHVQRVQKEKADPCARR